jgi:hypothetical protein
MPKFLLIDLIRYKLLESNFLLNNWNPVANYQDNRTSAGKQATISRLRFQRQQKLD